jgi:hypothetical protein
LQQKGYFAKGLCCGRIRLVFLIDTIPMKKAFVFLVILFLTNVPSLYYALYIDYSWFDTVQHFLGGFFVAMFMTAYLKDALNGNNFKNLLVIAGATILIGVVWEFAEYIANQTLIEPTYKYFGIKAYFMGDLRDTMIDLLMDISGSLVFGILHLLWSRKPHQVQAEA